MTEPVRVLIVDDSSFFRKRIRHFLEESPGISVVGEAANGEEAVRLNQQLSPDLVTMDVAMPVLDGISAVRRIMREHPTRIIMFSALTREGAQATLEALDAGAVDFIPKVSDDGTGASNGMLLRNRVLEIAGRRTAGASSPPSHPTAPSPLPAAAPFRQPPERRKSPGAIELVLIGASTGGPVAVQDVLTRLPAGFAAPLLVAVHMPQAFTGPYAERLDGVCQLRVAEARDGDALLPGRVLVAPGGQQIRVERRGKGLIVRLSDGGEHLYKPSVDNVFSSAAEQVGAGVLAVVLTGMGSDGAEGARRLRQRGATVWAQDQASSVVYGMPAAVARNGSAERVLPLAQIGDELRERC